MRLSNIIILGKKQSQMPKYFIAMLFVNLSIMLSNGYSIEILTESERKFIEDFVQEVRVEDSIGQLIMTGLPHVTDKDKMYESIDEIVCECKVGNIFLGRITSKSVPLKDVIDKLQKCAQHTTEQNTTNRCQSCVQQTAQRISLFISVYNNRELMPVEFDNEAFMSLPELTLASSKNEDLIGLAGQLQGAQLQNMGINLMLGPCLNLFPEDVGNIKPESQRHYFGCLDKHIEKYASAYIDGLHRSNMAVIGRYLPAMTFNQEHKYKGEISNVLINKDVSRFIDGIMMSKTQLVQAENLCNRPATFSKSFINEVVRGNDKININIVNPIYGLDFKDQLIISDDLSKRKQSNSIEGFTDRSFRAFDAGNDILFFSNISITSTSPSISKTLSSNANMNTNTCRYFSINDLKEIKNKLIASINQFPEKEIMFRESLRRILLLKARVIKSLCGKFEGIESLTNICRFNPQKKVYHNSFNDLVGDTKIYTGTTSTDFILNLTQKATIEIKSGKAFENGKTCDLSALNNNSITQIVFCINDAVIDRFSKDSYNALYPIKFVAIPQKKQDKCLSTIRSYLVESNNFIIYTVLDQMDADLINNVFIEKATSFSDRVLIFLHTSPLSLSLDFYTSTATIIGNFSSHKKSYEIDRLLLKGEYQKLPDKRNLTIKTPIFDPFKYENNNLIIKEEKHIETMIESLWCKDQLKKCKEQSDKIISNMQLQESVYSRELSLVQKDCSQKIEEMMIRISGKDHQILNLTKDKKLISAESDKKAYRYNIFILFNIVFFILWAFLVYKVKKMGSN